MFIFKFLFNVVIALISIPFVGPVKLAKWLNKKVYSGWRTYGGWQFAWGLVTSVAAAIGSYVLLRNGGQLGFSLFGFESWLANPHPRIALGGSSLVFFLTAVYGYPIVWLTVMQWFWRIWNAYYIRVTKFFARSKSSDGVYESNGYRLARDSTRFLRFLPFSQKLWDLLVKEQDDSVVLGIESIVVGAGMAWSAWLAAHAVYLFAHAVVPNTVLGALASAFGAYIALIVFGMVVYPLVRLLHSGKAYALGIFASLAAAYAVWTFVVPMLGTGFIEHWLTPVAALWLVFAYLFPLVTLLFSNGLLKRLYKRIEPIFNSVYDDKNSGFRHLIQQFITLAGVGAVGFGWWWFFTVAHMPVWLGTAWLALLPVAVFATYSLLGEALDWTGGNYFTGGIAALAAAGKTFLTIGATGWVHVVAISIPASVFALLASFFLVYPIIYWVLRWAFTLPVIGVLTNGAGEFMHSLHQFVWRRFEDLSRACGRVYASAYANQSDFRKLANHVANIIVAGALAYAMFVGASSSGYGMLVDGLTSFVVFTLAYLLGKKLIFRDKVQQASGGTALVLAIGFGASVQVATPFGLWFAVPASIAFGALIYGLAIPLIYVALRSALDPWFTNLALPVFDAIYAAISQQFGFVITAIEWIFNFLKPFFDLVVHAFAFGWGLLADAWSNVFGGKTR